jgi:uncharacterized peroxidase-related enzyme
MAWIEMIDEKEARGTLADLFREHGNRVAGVDNILRIHSLNPASLELHYAYYEHIMRGSSGLSRAQREMVAVVVSATNGCHY